MKKIYCMQGLTLQQTMDHGKYNVTPIKHIEIMLFKSYFRIKHLILRFFNEIEIDS